MKRWQIVLIGLLISAAFLYASLRQADPARIIEAYRTARWGFVALSFAMVVGTVYLRALRWSVLTQGRLSVGDSFWLFNIGFLFNNVLPARLGEFARAMLAGRRPQMHFTSALSSIVVERLFDLVSVVVLLGIVLLGLPLPGWATTAGAAIGVGSVAAIVVLAAAARWPEWALNLGSRILAIIPRISQEQARGFLAPFVDGLGGVSDPRTFALGLMLSVVAWLGSGVATWVMMLAFWSSVPLIVGMMAVAAAGLGIAVPAAPSGVGPFEAAVIGVLSAIGYDANISRSFAFALHGANFLMTSVLGVIGLMREGISFQEVASEARALKQREIADTPVEETPAS